MLDGSTKASTQRLTDSGGAEDIFTGTGEKNDGCLLLLSGGGWVVRAGN